MNEDRSALAWLAVPMTFGILLLGVLLWMGFSSWSHSDRHAQLSGAGGPVLPHLQGGAASAEEVEPPLPPSAEPGLSEEEINAWLDELLRRKVQGVGAIENEAILRFKSREAYEDFLRRAGSVGLKVLGQLDDFLSVRIGYADIEALRHELLANGENLEDVGANFLVRIPGVPEAEERTEGGVQPFGDSLLPALGITADNSTWGQGVKVAVLDAGLTNHPVFANTKVEHLDLVNDGQPFNGHGDAMGDLVRQIAPGAELYDIRIFDANGDGDSFILAQGIKAAVDGGAQVINVSGASYGDSQIVREAIAYAQSQGVWLVAAAGNEQGSMMAYPAAYMSEYPNVIGVTAVGQEGKLAYFSNAGGPAFAAPGVGIESAYSWDGVALYAIGNGTSHAAALGSGAVAVKLAQGEDPLTALLSTAKPGDGTPHEIGAGILYLGSPENNQTNGNR